MYCSCRRVEQRNIARTCAVYSCTATGVLPESACVVRGGSLQPLKPKQAGHQEQTPAKSVFRRFHLLVLQRCGISRQTTGGHVQLHGSQSLVMQSRQIFRLALQKSRFRS